jgi:hypothetical protein
MLNVLKVVHLLSCGTMKENEGTLRSEGSDRIRCDCAIVVRRLNVSQPRPAPRGCHRPARKLKMLAAYEILTSFPLIVDNGHKTRPVQMNLTMDHQEEETTGVSASPSSPLQTLIVAYEEAVAAEDDTEIKDAEIESSPDATAVEEADAISCKQTVKTRSVSFSSIEVREYPLCIGDNPGCRFGVSSCVR